MQFPQTSRFLVEEPSLRSTHTLEKLENVPLEGRAINTLQEKGYLKGNINKYSFLESYKAFQVVDLEITFV